MHWWNRKLFFIGMPALNKSMLQYQNGKPFLQQNKNTLPAAMHLILSYCSWLLCVFVSSGGVHMCPSEHRGQWQIFSSVFFHFTYFILTGSLSDPRAHPDFSDLARGHQASIVSGSPVLVSVTVFCWCFGLWVSSINLRSSSLQGNEFTD